MHYIFFMETNLTLAGGSCTTLASIVIFQPKDHSVSDDVIYAPSPIFYKVYFTYSVQCSNSSCLWPLSIIPLLLPADY